MTDLYLRRDLIINADDRGTVRETYRASWFPDVPPIVQLVRSESRPKVLRAMHAHKLQWDVWQVLAGNMTVALYDHRTGEGDVLALDNTQVIAIPPGVSHGFYTHEGCLLQYGLTVEYDGTDEFGWSAYDIPFMPNSWPSSEWVVRSERDRLAPPLSEFVKKW